MLECSMRHAAASYTVRSFFLLMLLFVLHIPDVTPSIIANSLMNICSSDNLKDCKTVLTITLAVPEGLEHGTGRIVLSQTTNEKGEIVYLPHPLKITFRKASSLLHYPLVYLKTVDAAPYEAHILTNIFDCDRVVEQMCGPRHGFCCRCAPCTISGLCAARTMRDKLRCRVGTMRSLVSCIRYSENWYHVYELQTPQLNTNITFEMGVNTSWEEKISVGTRVPKIKTPNMVVEYHADLGLSVASAMPESRYFVISSHGNNPALIEKSRFSLEGSQCNKIGVSPESYVHQAERCRAPAGYGLRNQITELQAEALARREKGLPTSFFLEDFGELVGFHKQANTLTYHIPSQRYHSLITLTVNATNLFFVDNILDVQVVFAGVSLQGKRSGSGRFNILAGVQNVQNRTGTITVGCNTSSSVQTVAIYTALRNFERKNVSLTGMANDVAKEQFCFLEIRSTGQLIAQAPLFWNMSHFDPVNPQLELPVRFSRVEPNIQTKKMPSPGHIWSASLNLFNRMKFPFIVLGVCICFLIILVFFFRILNLFCCFPFR